MILIVLSLAPIAENKLFNVTCLKKVMRSRKITYIIKNTHWQPRKIFSWFLFWLSIAIPPRKKLTLLGDYYTLLKWVFDSLFLFDFLFFSYRCFSATGSLTSNTVISSSLIAYMLPLCILTISFAIAKPSPVPLSSDSPYSLER